MLIYITTIGDPGIQKENKNRSHSIQTRNQGKLAKACWLFRHFVRERKSVEAPPELEFIDPFELDGLFPIIVPDIRGESAVVESGIESLT